MRRLLALSVVAFMAITMAMPAVAATLSVSFAAERREWHGPIPAVIEVARLDTSAVAGQSCAVAFHASNNTSEHDTDLIVDTGGQLATVFDIERGPGSETDFDLGVLTVGDVVIVKLRLNEYNARGFAVSSLGGTVTLDCQEQPSTTTTTSPESTTSSSTTSIPSTTTTQPNPTTTSSPQSEESTTTSSPAPTTTVGTESSTTTVQISQTSITPPTIVDTSWPEQVTTTPETITSTIPDRLPDTGAVGVGTLLLSAVGLAVTGGFTAWRFRNH